MLGHEIAHTFEGTEHYKELVKLLNSYAKTVKTEAGYKKQKRKTERLYEGIEDANAENELNADLLGEYVWSDENFVKHLLNENRNVFQKVWDEVKYLYKYATAGSQTQRDLLRIKKVFEKAWREGSTAQKNATDNGGVKYDLMSLEDGSVYVKASRNVITGKTKAEQRKNISDFFTRLLGQNPSIDIQTVEGDVLTITKAETADKARDDHKTVKGKRVKMTDEEFAVKLRVESHIDEVAVASSPAGGKGDYKNHSFTKDGFTYRRAYFEDFDGQYYEITLSIGNNGTVATVYNVGKIKEGNPPSANLIAVVGSKPLGESPSFVKSVPQTKLGVKKNFSLSDNTGKELSKEQQEYFKDSKMRDDSGNLMVMYHGSQNAGFHVFDSRMSDDDTSFFFVDRNDVAASYSGTSETYEAKSIRSAEDMNKFLAEIGQSDYRVVEKNGIFELLYDGGRVAISDTAQGIYDEFCWYEGVGEGDANYKVYLNLKNPLVVDAQGKNWNNISREFSQEVYHRYQSLTAEEKTALVQLAEWGEYSIFRDEMLEARAGDAPTILSSAYEKLGGANAEDTF